MTTSIDDHRSLVGILNRVQGWITAADQKIGVITAIQTIVSGFLFNEISDRLETERTSIAVRVALHLGAIPLAVGIGYSVIGLFPQLRKQKRRWAPGQSATFFGHIQALPLEEYRKKLSDMTDDDWREDYVAQIHNNAIIANDKYQAVQYSVIWFGIGLLVITIAYFMALAGY